MSAILDKFFKFDVLEKSKAIFTNPYQSNIDRYKEFNRVPVCEHPFSVLGRLVPCGHCALCLSRTKKEWINRNQLEQTQYKDSFFGTFTFNDEHLPNAIYPTFQKFLKRLRKIYGKFRYFGCFEKGEKSGRPHFHCLFYGISAPKPIFINGKRMKTSSEVLADIWQQGFCKVDVLAPQTIAYVCGYVMKKREDYAVKPESMTWKEHIKASKYSYYYKYKSTYFFMSKGIGYCLLKRADEVCKKGYYVLNGYKKGIGKWFRDKLKRINTFISKGLLWLFNGCDEPQESCELLPDFVMNHLLKFYNTNSPTGVKISSEADDVDLYFMYFGDMVQKNLQKARTLSILNGDK